MTMAVPNRPFCRLYLRQFCLLSRYHVVTAAISPALVDQRSGICLDPPVHLQRLCARRRWLGEKSCSRLNRGEAVMSHAPRSRPAKQRTNRKAASEALFNPAVFLETAALGRVISTHSKKEVIFAQGDDADSVFYIRKGKVKVAIVSKQGKEAVIPLLGPAEFVGEVGWC